MFQIPELPAGQDLVINILSTWGDCHYVGLTGLEVYQKDGQPVEIARVRRGSRGGWFGWSEDEQIWMVWGGGEWIFEVSD